ncbi:hypothetical protein LD112_07925 [Pantoea agglomerans]|nr:hypothetical protein [Pantoea agglomerans]
MRGTPISPPLAGFFSFFNPLRMRDVSAGLNLRDWNKRRELCLNTIRMKNVRKKVMSAKACPKPRQTLVMLTRKMIIPPLMRRKIMAKCRAKMMTARMTKKDPYKAS